MNEAELILSEVLGCDRAELYRRRSAPLGKEEGIFLSSALKRRFLGEPLQYILGNTEFMGLRLTVNKYVFIPRPETEILVEKIIELVQGSGFIVQGLNILDVGTGSGCIAISLAKFLKNTGIYASDISAEAIEVARENAKLNNASINFLQSDLFFNQELRTMNYELIICNPPYIPAGEIGGLQPELRYEPRAALDGGRDGLAFYRRIIRESPPYLAEEGFLALEIGCGQRKAVEGMLRASGNFRVTDIARDYNHIERVIIARRKKNG